MELIKHDVVYVPASETEFDDDLNDEVFGLKKVYNGEGFFAKEAKRVYVLTEDNLAEIIVAARHVCTTMSAVDFVEDLPSIMGKLKNKNES